MLRAYKTIRNKRNRVHIIPEYCCKLEKGEDPLNELIYCRICYGGGRNLISPCDCKGSVWYIHKHCLLKWIKISESKKCEICKTKYKVNIINRNRLSWFKKMKKRMMGRNRSYRISIYDL